MKIRIAVLLALACIADLAAAQSFTGNAGTTGVGAELGYGLNSYFGVRGSLGAGSYTYDDQQEDVTYNAKLKLGVGLLAGDWHPFRGVFRLSAGLAYNNTRVDGTAQPTSGTITINDVDYNASDVGIVKAKIRFKKTVPYVGLGWGNRAGASNGFFFSSDFGVFFGRASASVTGTCGATLSALQCAQLQSDLEAESQSVNEEAQKVKYYPVIRIGIGYRF
jgi:hypothetical protein